MTTLRDKLPDYRNRYYRLKRKEAKSNFLTRLVETYDLDRKYLIKLLNGQRDFKESHGRGRTYGKMCRKMILKLRRYSHDLCAPYFKEMLPKLISDYEKLYGKIDLELRKQLLSMSISTISRIFSSNPSSLPRHGNKKSGANKFRNNVPSCPGKAIEDGLPGVAQLDSVAHGGGGYEPFFYSVGMTDAVTQWTEYRFTWCRSAEVVVLQVENMLQSFPFEIRKLHPDGGSEFINNTLLKIILKKFPSIEVSKSRPSRPNDNCRIEQKNGSIMRVYLGEIRLDNKNLEADLNTLAGLISIRTNLFTPSKKLIEKQYKDDKHSKIKYKYDKCSTPFNRLKEIDPNNLNIPKYEEIIRNVNLISLNKSIDRLTRSIIKESTHVMGVASHTHYITEQSLGVQANEKRG